MTLRLFHPFSPISTRPAWSFWTTELAQRQSRVGQVHFEENPDNYKIHVETPGLDEKNVKVLLSPDKSLLTISAEQTKTNDADQEKDTFHKFMSFSRSFTLPDDAQNTDILATVSKGVTTIEITKSQPNPPVEPLEIEVKAGKD